MVDRPLRRQIHLNRLSQEVGPPLFALVLFPLSVIADFVPFIGSIVGAGALLVALVCTFVLAPALIAVAWLWYRPLISIAVLAVGLGVAYGLRTLAARRTPARAQAA
jgi:hypothetical protein